jgi:hypothetical protein
MGAVLFRLADLVTSGAKTIPVDGPACTDVLCEWTKPKGEVKNHRYKQINEVLPRTFWKKWPHKFNCFDKVEKQNLVLSI